jgi:hypothetical protein
MSVDHQAETLWEHGTFLTNIADDSIRANLYSLYDFYVETVFIDENTFKIQTYKRGKRLDAFLEGIDLNDLLE